MSILEVKNIKKNFGSNTVLNGISFSLEKGEVLAIIGSSGSGKTTLLRCLNFLETANEGQIVVNGETLFDVTPSLQQSQDENATIADNSNTSSVSNNLENDINLQDKNATTNDDKISVNNCKKNANKSKKKTAISYENIRKKRLHFGLVFQNFNLFPHYNVLRNITIASELLAKEKLKEAYAQKKAQKPKLSFAQLRQQYAQEKAFTLSQIESDALKLLERVGLQDKAKAYPCELSGGQCQRVAIARALALSPDILCFDEPTSALDPELTGEVLKVIKSLKSADSTMIVVTHEMDFAYSVADKIIFMANGVIEEMGTPQQIFDNPQSPLTQAFLQNVKNGFDE